MVTEKIQNMALIPIFTAIRIIPRDAEYLDRKSGSRGEIYLDNDNQTLRIYDGTATGGVAMAKADLTNIDNATFAAKVTASGFAGGGGSGEITISADDSTQRNIGAGETFSLLGGDGISTTTDAEGALTITNTANNFGTISVDGQDNIVADTNSDTLTVVAGTNITIETDATADSITIHAAAGASTNSFNTISVSGQSNVVADSATDTLTLVAGSGISITTNAGSDSVTITNSAIINNFSDTADAITADLTVDKFYLPAITSLNVTANGASAYRFDQYGTADNPQVYAINGTTIAFNLNTLNANHPFKIQTAAAIDYSDGLIHVANDGTVSTGSSAQGKISGVLYWKISSDISGNYRYQCSLHAPMVGIVSIKNFGSI